MTEASGLPLVHEPSGSQCPYCLAPVGYLGRFLAWIFGTQIHQCDFSNVDDEAISSRALEEGQG